jgi:hypothetical protein
MSLNNIQLSRQQLTEMYSSVLVETEVIKTAPPKAVSKYLGKNNLNILIMVKEENLPFLTDEHLNFLTNILSACKLSLADIALVNVNSLEPSEISETIQELNGQKIISFGIDPIQMGLPVQFPFYQIQRLDNRTYIHSPELAVIEKDKSQKQNLWMSLKTLFGI